ncbi:MAG TPA: ATP-dependent Clp protease proteolytic subunit [bacterium]|nr:ATP-dependent Clp protease proteolytic subunit [bacterium]
MQNPRQSDPSPRRLDEDCEHDQNDKKGDGLPNVYEKALFESRTLLMSGPVDDKMLKDATVRALAMEAEKPDAPITVMINSPGGSADAGFAIYDLLRFISCPIRTVVNGLCASAGILIHLAGDAGTRYCMPEARFMIHQPSSGGRGQASDLDITAKEILKLRDRYNKIIAEACGKTPEDVLEAARRDFWLDAGQALEYQLVDKVIATRKDLPA